MIAYKGFEAGLVCRGYQFHVGLNTTDEANCAKNGFHCASNPLDCLTYYSNMEQSEYWLVDAGGDIDEDNCDSKISCTELTILHRLTRKEFFLFALAYMHDHPLLEWNSHVIKDSGIAAYGFAVVRGIDPIAKGKLGDILALAKETSDGTGIEQIGVTVVDGTSILPDVWYDVNFQTYSAGQQNRSAAK